MPTMVKSFQKVNPALVNLAAEIEDLVNPWLRTLPGDAQVQTTTLLVSGPAPAAVGGASYYLVVTFTVTAATLDGL